MRRAEEVLVLALGLALGCAGRPGPSAVDPSLVPSGPGTGPTPIAAVASPRRPAPRALAPLGQGPIPRRALTDALQSGMGHFLTQIEVAPALSQGRFVGFRLLTAEHLDDWRRHGLDLRLGDVITAVNGHPVERPEGAVEALRACATASALRVDLRREGAAESLSVPISEP